jgi:hypothetical protein
MRVLASSGRSNANGRMGVSASVSETVRSIARKNNPFFRLTHGRSTSLEHDLFRERKIKIEMASTIPTL